MLIRELADEFQVHEDQIYNDLDALEIGGHGIDICTRSAVGPSGKVRNMAVAVLAERSGGKVALTREEKYSMLAVRRVFDVLKDTPLFKDIDAVFEKLVRSIPTADKEELEAWGRRFVYVADGGVKDYSKRKVAGVLDTLRTAVLNRRVLRYVYEQASGRVQRGFLAPYAMVLYRHGPLCQCE